MEELEPKDGISRRKMIKRIGAGAAIAWTAPILTSIRTPAFAQYACQPSCDPGQTCSGCQGSQACHGRDDCNCWPLSPDQGGCCQCLFFTVVCGEFGSCPNGQSDCGPDLTCIQTCCGQTCTPACGAANVRSRRRTTGGARTTR